MSRTNKYAISGVFEATRIVKAGNQPDVIAFTYLVALQMENSTGASDFIQMVHDELLPMLRKDYPGITISTEKMRLHNYDLIDSFENVDEDGTNTEQQ